MHQPRSSNLYQLVESLYQRALDVPSDSRLAFIERECAGDTAVVDEVRALLLHFDAVDHDFLAGPAHDLPADADVKDHIPEYIGPYRIIRIIGVGGMGVVYEAAQEHPRRSVALKVIRPGMPSVESLRRFQHEAEVLGQLDHPGIARIYEAGSVRVALNGNGRMDQPYLVMELVRGSPLVLHARRGELSLTARLELLARVCDAVQYAHRKGVIHRDLKPANILVDEAGQPKVLDFGVARVSRAGTDTLTMHTNAGQLIGTLPYMSPEQASGNASEIDTRSDVYSLGVMAYELLTDHTPFNVAGVPLAQAIRTICDTEPARLSIHNASLRGDLEDIVARAMEKEVPRRYGSASDLADDIRRYLRSEPVSAHPATMMYQCARFARRHRGLVGGALAAIIALVAGTIGTATFAWRAQRESAKATAQAARAEAVTAFLRDMLSSVDPRRLPGQELSVRQVLNSARGRLDAGELSAQPNVEATLRTALGETYLHLGQYADARPQLEAALRLHLQVHGELSADVVAVKHLLGATLVGLGDATNAVRYSREALDAAIALYGAEHRQVAGSLGDLGLCASAANDDSLAEESYRHALQLLRSLPEVPIQERAVGLHNLGALLLEQHRLAEAEPLLREAADIRRQHLHADDPALAGTLNVLGQLYRQLKRDDDSERLFREVLAIRRRTLDARHPDIALTLNSLAGLVKERGRAREAIELYQEAVRILEHADNAGQPELGKVLLNLCGLLCGEGDCPQALKVGSRACEVLRRIHGGPHVNVALAMHNLAMSQRHCGDIAAAAVTMREALDMLADRLPANHLNVAHLQDSLGTLLVLLDRHSEALPYLEASLATRTDRLGSDDFLVALTATHICVPRLRCGDPAAAASAARTSIRLLRAHPRSRADLAIALTCLAEATLSLDSGTAEKAEAVEAVTEAIQIRREEYGEGSKPLAEAEEVLSKLRQMP